jgi:hypothetical protein
MVSSPPKYAMQDLLQGALSTAIQQKLTRFFECPAKMARLLVFAQGAESSALLDLVAFYVTQHCARNNVRVATSTSVVRYSVFCQYRKMVNQYTKAYFSPAPIASALDRSWNGLPLPQAHFFFWIISNDIDHEFFKQRDSLNAEMLKYRQTITKAYRERQRARSSKRRREGTGGCELMPTAARQARSAPVDVVACCRAFTDL